MLPQLGVAMPTVFASTWRLMLVSHVLFFNQLSTDALQHANRERLDTPLRNLLKRCWQIGL